MPPGKLANILTDSMGLVSLSVLKNRLRHLWTVIVKNHGLRYSREKTFNIWIKYHVKSEERIIYSALVGLDFDFLLGNPTHIVGPVGFIPYFTLKKELSPTET